MHRYLCLEMVNEPVTNSQTKMVYLAAQTIKGHSVNSLTIHIDKKRSNDLSLGSRRRALIDM